MPGIEKEKKESHETGTFRKEQKEIREFQNDSARQYEKTKGILKPTVQSIRTASGDLQRN